MQGYLSPIIRMRAGLQNLQGIRVSGFVHTIANEPHEPPYNFYGGDKSVNQDKTLTCRDCDKDFTFSASEQDFFAEKGFTNEPSRCGECRATRKQQNSGGFSRGANNFQKREMHPATCAECGKETQVPFRPSGDRPVYCSDCFSRNSRH